MDLEDVSDAAESMAVGEDVMDVETEPMVVEDLW